MKTFIQFIYSANWIGYSFMAFFLLVIWDLSIPYFIRVHSIKPEAIAIPWGLGCALGMILLAHFYPDVTGLKIENLYRPVFPFFFVFLFGLLFGTLLQITVCKGLAGAADTGNVGRASIIIASAAGLVYLISGNLNRILPSSFADASFKWQHFVGIILSVFGIWLVVKD